MLRRLDYLSPWLAVAVGFGGSALLGAVVLTWLSPIVGSVLFLALLGGAVFVAYSGEPITVVLQPDKPEPVPTPPEPPVPGPVMVSIPAEAFHMGSPEDEDGRYENEGPVHEVRISAFDISAFEMMRVPVTKQLYAEVMDAAPPEEDADERPVVDVSWFDAVQFCNRLSERLGLTPCYRIDDENVVWEQDADGYRLPTEAEWEYAARAGTQTRWSFGDDEAELGRYAWYSANTYEPQPVGQKEPNAWGLYDMHGNVFEWCWDWYGPYSEVSQTDQSGPSECLANAPELPDGRSAITRRHPPAFRHTAVACVPAT
jgi:formylglycine-generating enzyme required for sulfatase activity